MHDWLLKNNLNFDFWIIILERKEDELFRELKHGQINYYYYY